MTALLLAPKSGKELQRRHEEKSRRTEETAQDRLTQVRTRAGELIEVGKKRSGEILGQAKQRTGTLLSDLKEYSIKQKVKEPIESGNKARHRRLQGRAQQKQLGDVVMALFLVIVSIALLAVAAASIYSIVLMKDAKHVLNQLESSVRDISEKSGPLLENSSLITGKIREIAESMMEKSLI